MDWRFLLQLLDNRRVGDYEVPVPLKVRRVAVRAASCSRALRELVRMP